MNCAGESEAKAHKESEAHEYLVVRVTGQMCARWPGSPRGQPAKLNQKLGGLLGGDPVEH